MTELIKDREISKQEISELKKEIVNSKERIMKIGVDGVKIDYTKMIKKEIED